MAHFAQLDENNIVINVIVVSNEDILDENGKESEQVGIEFCKKLFGEDTNWIQTSYNRNFRLNYAGIGSFYDSEKDIFVPKKEFNSWIFNQELNMYEPPIDEPIDEKKYIWDEETISWKEVVFDEII